VVPSREQVWSEIVKHGFQKLPTMMRVSGCVQVVYDPGVLGYVDDKNDVGEENHLIVPRGRLVVHLHRLPAPESQSPANAFAFRHQDSSIQWARIRNDADALACQ